MGSLQIGCLPFDERSSLTEEIKLSPIMPSKTSKAKIPKNASTPSPKKAVIEAEPVPESPRGDVASQEPQAELQEVSPIIAPPIAKKGRGRPAGVAGDRTRKKKKKDHRYSQHVGIVLRQVHPDFTISKQAMATMNSFLDDVFERVVAEAAKLAHHPQRYSKRSAITVREIQTSCRLLLPGELAKHGISEGTKAVTKYFSDPK